jgi:hypothetical protein
MADRFNNLDLDGDGRISIAEFMEGLQLRDVWEAMAAAESRTVVGGAVGSADGSAGGSAGGSASDADADAGAGYVNAEEPDKRGGGRGGAADVSLPPELRSPVLGPKEEESEEELE